MNSHTKQSQYQNGSVSILSIIVVVSVIAVSAGLLAVAESQSHRSDVQYAVQSSANAASYTYGTQYLKNLKDCIKTKILEESPEPTPMPNETVCVQDDIIACAESDFKDCNVHLNECWDDAESPIQQCQEDAEVLAKSEDSARQAAEKIAHKYDIDDFSIRKNSDSFNTQGSKTLQSQIPTFGQSRKNTAQAASTIHITQQSQ